MLPFFIPFKVDIEKHTLKPYIAPVNHNVLNETTWINIVETLMEFFGHDDSKINTMPLEDMGHDDCVVVGYHNNVPVFILNVHFFSKMENTVGNVP